ncbi:GF22565, related [Neospora caninum Liverpool]|uniref:GF22565, related n=1 Tax=Neospora caninum (strain Liverpool) TaxID=572307 RepID=F0VD60_NEOCL|nr:GF22565, related [Neospora caninum Liverpool]CBZ51575.1 GF22565, related [Neospora caninum Liverpool]CEL65525.1 TPA: GF22565, related [Neospora caninum Liverpool]|eukprot:XP_003881608.1 GF22565, related [Neospora caninum Liverpool]
MLPFCGVNAETLAQALKKQKLRVDGRSPDHFRRLQISFRRSNGHAEIALGRTRCLSQVTASPFALLPTDRASDGEISFRVALSPSIPPTSAELAGQSALSASLAAADTRRRSTKSSELERELERMLRRLLKDSGVVDTEALCIQSGKWAWHVRVAVTVVEDDGNLRDTALLAALCGLMHFKKEAVTFDGDQAVFHRAADREPLPLCIHHLPILVSFAFLPTRGSLLNLSAPKGEGEDEEDALPEPYSSQTAGKREDERDDEDDLDYVVDPSALEEATLPGKVSIAVGKQGDICGMYKVGGPVLRFSHLIKLTNLATAKAKELLSIVQAAVQQERESHQRRLRTNARSRYEEPCVLLTLPDKHTLPLPSTAPPLPPHLDSFSAAPSILSRREVVASPPAPSSTGPVSAFDAPSVSSPSGAAVPCPRRSPLADPIEGARGPAEDGKSEGKSRRSLDAREASQRFPASGKEQSTAHQSVRFHCPPAREVSDGIAATKQPQDTAAESVSGAKIPHPMTSRGSDARGVGDSDEEALDLSSAISSSFASKVKKLRKSP